MINIKLSKTEQNKLFNLLSVNKDFVLNNWLNQNSVKNILSKYQINDQEQDYYINYLGAKLIKMVIDNIREEFDEEKINTYNIISTNFFDFIQLKKIPVGDLVELLFFLKSQYSSLLGVESGNFLLYINNLFDCFFKIFTKNYYDGILRLLHQYENAVDQLNIVSKINIHGKITYANDEFCKLSGFSIVEIIGKHYDFFIHQDIPKSTINALWKTIESKKTWSGILKNLTKDNSSFWSKTTMIPLVDANDNVVEYICIRDDITEIIELNKNLEEYMNALNESTIVIKLDKNHRIIDVNDLFLHTSGFARDNIIGTYYIINSLDKNIDKSLICAIPIVGEDMINEIKSNINSKQSWKGIIKNKDITGNFFWTSTNITPILNINNEIIEFVIISTDITNLKIAQINLHDSFEKLKELDVRKDEFMSISSHELRTPMTAIKGYLSMVIDGDYGKIPESAKQVLTHSYDSALRVIEIVNNMFDLSKIESGKMSFDISEFEVHNFLKKIGEDMLIIGKTKDVSFVATIAEDIIGYKVNTDRYKLNQVVSNLITNAFKFTNSGGKVILNAFKFSSKQICVEIIDTGIGIPETELENIFSKFYQVDSYTKRKEEGLGLGLALSQNIMKSLGYEIQVNSKVGEGSKFYFFLNIID